MLDVLYPIISMEDNALEWVASEQNIKAGDDDDEPGGAALDDDDGEDECERGPGERAFSL